MAAKRNYLAETSLFFGAITWGLFWYPLRTLEQSGLTGAAITFVAYIFALALGTLYFYKSLHEFRRIPQIAIWIGILAGWTNLGYAIALLHGEVVRVVLLFYLAPFWTVILARLILNERLDFYGYMVMAWALGGAFVMLWNPTLGIPVPRNPAEWLSLSGGFTFALTNVLTKRAHHVSLAMKSFVVWIGVGGLALLLTLYDPPAWGALAQFPSMEWGWIAVLVAAILLVTVTMQYGLTHTPANRAIVICLVEIVASAVSSYYLAGEGISIQEWIGGAMIVMATLFTGKFEGSVEPLHG
jgi:drug/metabolite transporter (DMT)-like permease